MKMESHCPRFPFDRFLFNFTEINKHRRDKVAKKFDNILQWKSNSTTLFFQQYRKKNSKKEITS